MLKFIFQILYHDYDWEARKEYREKLTQDLYEIQKYRMPLWQ